MKRNVLLLAVVAAVGACSGEPMASTPGATIEELTRKLDTGRCVGLREYFTSNMRETFGDKIDQGCTKNIERRRKLPDPDSQRLKQVTIHDTQEQGDRAIVLATFENRAGEKEGPQSYVLVREEGRWRLDLLATTQLNRAGAAGPGGPEGPLMPPPGAPGGPEAPMTPAPAPAPTN
jgi:hypothetical protein